MQIQSVGVVMKRAIAWAIDYLLLVVASYILTILINNTRGDNDIAYYVCILPLAIVTYHATFEYIWAGSLGKVITGLRVTTDDRSKLKLSQVIIRAVFVIFEAFIWYASLVVIIRGGKGKRIGDLVAHTRVDYKTL